LSEEAQPEVLFNMFSKAKVKNKAPAEIQITAEQLLREAKERELEILPPVSHRFSLIQR
jgi:hypothetical protein